MKGEGQVFFMTLCPHPSQKPVTLTLTLKGGTLRFSIFSILWYQETLIALLGYFFYLFFQETPPKSGSWD